MKNKRKRNTGYKRGLMAVGVLLVLLLLFIGKGCSANDSLPMTFTRKDFYARRDALVNTSATGNETKSVLNASLRSTVEKMLPQDYEIVDSFAVCYSTWLLDSYHFEHWVLAQPPEGEEVVIVFVMYDEDDAHLMDKCITDSMSKIPSYEAVPANPGDEVAHFYLLIPKDDPARIFYETAK